MRINESQASNLEETASSIEEMTSTVQQNAALVEESAAASDAMTQKVRLLAGLPDQFKQISK